jgi:hypothetical protein
LSVRNAAPSADEFVRDPAALQPGGWKKWPLSESKDS